LKLYVVLSLLSPYDLPSPPCDDAETVAALKEVAEEIELTDHRDHWRPNYAEELEWSKDQLSRLRNCPSVELAATLPDHALCLSRLQFANSLHCYWESQAGMTPARAAHFRPLLNDLCWRIECWGAAADATRPDQVRCRRQALRRLQLLTDYGELPSHVSPAAFREME